MSRSEYSANEALAFTKLKRMPRPKVQQPGYFWFVAMLIFVFLMVAPIFVMLIKGVI